MKSMHQQTNLGIHPVSVWTVWALLWITSAHATPTPTPNVPLTAISQIQQYQGVQEGDRVWVQGVCICESARFGYAMTVIADEDYGPWGAIFVYDMDQRLIAERGDTVSVVGIVQEYYEKTELSISNETEYPPVITGAAIVPDALYVTCEQAADEAYESCLVVMESMEVATNPDAYGNITLLQGDCDFPLLLRLTDPPPPIGYVYDCIMGIDDFHFGEFKLRPRNELDLDCTFPGTATPTPTVTPSPTPTSAQSATSTPTPGDCALLGVELNMPDSVMRPGYPCWCRATLCNPGQDTYTAIPFFAVLDFFGTYYFAPSMSEFDFLEINLEPGIMEISIIEEFLWPHGAGAASGLMWYAAMTNPDMTEILGEMSVFEFGWQVK